MAKPSSPDRQRSAPTSETFIRVDPAQVEEVGPSAAILFARILWRSQETGSWRASRALLQEETGLTQPMLRTAVDVLRDLGWVSSERTSYLDATLIWTPVCPGRPDGAPSAPPPASSTPTPPAESADFSLETGRDLPPPSPPVEEQATLPLLTVVPPVREPEPETTDETGPPKTAQTLVARWCDGYRSVNDGRDAHRSVMGRVAGQARNLAKACGTDHDSWVDAYHAAYAAGVAGSWDLTRHLIPQQQRRTSMARRNVFADPSMGGPGADVMGRFSAMLAGGEQPRALESGS